MPRPTEGSVEVYPDRRQERREAQVRTRAGFFCLEKNQREKPARLTELNVGRTKMDARKNSRRIQDLSL